MQLDFAGIHHLSLPTSELAETVGWLVRSFGAQENPALEHRRDDGAVYGRVLMVPGVPVPVLVLTSPGASVVPLGLLVDDLDEWIARRAGDGVACSQPAVRVGGRSVDILGPGGVSIRVFQRRSASESSAWEALCAEPGPPGMHSPLELIDRARRASVDRKSVV